jgi:SAM-dependent methyltransferase
VLDAETEGARADLGLSAAYDWYLCHVCGNAYPSEQANLEILSQGWAKARDDQGCDASVRESRNRHRMRISRIGGTRAYANFAGLSASSPGRFLDIACGHGGTAKIFADHGWKVLGTDADPSTKPVHEALGLETRIGQIENMEIEGKFDIVHIAHAIYFVQSPRRFFDRVHSLLAPGGLFCVTIADFMSSNDPSWPGYLHSFFPTGASMRFALARAGFKPIWWRRQGGSIHIAARACEPGPSRVWPALIRLGFATKPLRYALWGRGRVALGQWARRLLGAN